MMAIDRQREDERREVGDATGNIGSEKRRKP